MTSTIPEQLAATVREHPERPAITYRAGGGWRTLSWHEVAFAIVNLSERLDELLGSVRIVAVLADTDPRYPVLELALGLTGRATLPLYVTATDEEIQRAIATVQAGAVVVGDRQLARAAGWRTGAPVHDLRTVVPLPGLETAAEVLPADVEPFDTAQVRARLAALPALPPMAPLLYLQSTGTTGPSRVVEVSASAMAHATEAVRYEASHPFPRFLSFLPTAHISERLLTTYVSLALAGNTWYGGGLASFQQDLLACRPTILLAPPLVLEAIRTEVEQTASRNALGRRLLAGTRHTAQQALATGRSGVTRRRPEARLLGRQVRRACGLDRVVDAFAGTAPLDPATQAWWEAIGLPVRNVYGQTEQVGATTMTATRGHRYDGVGVAVRGADLCISPDGELLVRSQSLITGYVGPSHEPSALPADGWLRSGDRATITPEGEVVLHGRIHQVVVAPSGRRVDLKVMMATLRERLGDVDLVLADVEGGRALYVACRPEGVPDQVLIERGQVTAASPDDPRTSTLWKALDEIDSERLITTAALFDGAFGVPTGELGPTGKLRSWRVHQLRAQHLRPRPEISSPASP